MVQVFGNRIIGGVGAPDPRMSEAFGAGVTTALGQRSTRQDMRLRDIDLQWKTEDREEAKRRRAAAAAEAAAARARGVAAIEAMRSGGAGGPYFQLGAKSTAGGATAPAPRAGVNTSFPLGVTRAPTTTGAVISGGAGSSSVSGGTGTDRLGAPAQTRFRPAGADTGATPSPFLRLPPAPDRSGGTSGTERNLGENSLARIPELLATEVNIGPDGTITTVAPGESAVTIQGPNGPVTVPAEPGVLDFAGVPAMGQGTTARLGFDPSTGAAPVVRAAPGDLSFAGVPAMGQETTTQLGFGPRLGAAPTPTEQFLSAVGSAPPGEIDIEALRSSYDSPLYDPLFAQSAEQMRTALVYAAEDAAARGDVGGYVTAMAKVREQEMLILSQQLEVGLDEAKRFNSPQRLSAVLSMVYGGTDIFIAPTEGGLADVYVNGQLSETGTSIDELAANVRIMVDTGFREQMATAAAEQRAATLEVQKAVATEQGKLEAKRDDDLVRAELQAIGFLPPDEAVRFDEYSTGEVIGFDFAGNEVVRYAPVSQEDGTVVLSEVRN